MRLILDRSRSLGRAALIAGMAVLPVSVPAMAAQQHGGTLIAAFSADPAGSDPVRGPSGMSHVVIEQVYSTLMLLDPDANPIPGLAGPTKCPRRQGVHLQAARRHFHNGDPLTAEDVKFSFDRLRAPDSGYSYGSQVETIDEVEVVDPLTVKFKLRQVTGPFLIYMAFPGSSIVPKKLVESGHDLNARPIGSGPFKFVLPAAQRHQVRAQSELLRRGQALLRRHGVPDHLGHHGPDQRGDVGGGQLFEQIPPRTGRPCRAIRIWSARPSRARVTTGSCPTIPNPRSTTKVRQAVAHAIDRQALVTGAFFGQATPILGGVIPQWNWGYADLGYFSPAAIPPRPSSSWPRPAIPMVSRPR